MKREAKNILFALLATSALTLAGCGGGGGGSANSPTNTSGGSGSDPVANDPDTSNPGGTTNDSFKTSYNSTQNEAAPYNSLTTATRTTVDDVAVADAESAAQGDYPPSPPVIRH